MSPWRGDGSSVPQAQGVSSPEGRGFCHPKGDNLLRPEGASRAPKARNIFRIHHSAVVDARPQLSLRGRSSSQASYPSPRRKRQVSSIALLVLSKQQTLRWFAVWSQFCLARKKYAKKRRWRREIALTRRKTIRSVVRISVTLSVVRTPFGRPSNRVSASHDKLRGRLISAR